MILYLRREKCHTTCLSYSVPLIIRREAAERFERQATSAPLSGTKFLGNIKKKDLWQKT
jgi:hypothetical protein